MRLPNGTGQIVKLSGKRRNPYAVYPPSKKRDKKTGKFIREKAIGYYHTKKEALEALFAWHKSPTLNTRITFKDMYDMWIAEKKKDNVSSKTITTYESLRSNFNSADNYIYSEMRINDFQGLLDDSELSWSAQNILRSMLKQIGKFALKNDYVVKDYASFIKIRKENDTVKGIPFTEDEVALFWRNVDTLDGVKTTLILIYSGLRISELKQTHIDLEKGVFDGGIKTDAGRNRIVPIHSKIRHFVEEFDQNEFHSNRWRASVFYPMLDKLGIRYVDEVQHTPHDCRHTFSWLADKYGMNTLSKNLIMGHTPQGVEDGVYGHRTVDELRNAIEQITM